MSWFPKSVVVVPVDFSEDSFAAVDTALQLAAAPSGVRIIHVLPESTEPEPGVIWKPADTEREARKTIKSIRDRLSDPKYREVQIDVAFGDPGYHIADFAQKIGADLIVTPAHRRTGNEQILVGSVAERVIRLSPCPVLVLRK